MVLPSRAFSLVRRSRLKWTVLCEKYSISNFQNIHRFDCWMKRAISFDLFPFDGIDMNSVEKPILFLRRRLLHINPISLVYVFMVTANKKVDRLLLQWGLKWIKFQSPFLLLFVIWMAARSAACVCSEFWSPHQIHLMFRQKKEKKLFMLIIIFRSPSTQAISYYSMLLPYI